MGSLSVIHRGLFWLQLLIKIDTLAKIPMIIGGISLSYREWLLSIILRCHPRFFSQPHEQVGHPSILSRLHECNLAFGILYFHEISSLQSPSGYDVPLLQNTHNRT